MTTRYVQPLALDALEGARLRVAAVLLSLHVGPAALTELPRLRVLAGRLALLALPPELRRARAVYVPGATLRDDAGRDFVWGEAGRIPRARWLSEDRASTVAGLGPVMVRGVVDLGALAVAASEKVGRGGALYVFARPEA